MNGAIVELNSTGRPSMEWELTIVTSTACTSLNVAVQSKDQVCYVYLVENTNNILVLGARMVHGHKRSSRES